MSDKLVLELNESNKVEVYLHGATITSWISNNNEILFLSKKSVFDNKKAIRGGIPIVFPNFGPWEKGPQHGFARIKKWNLQEPLNKTSDSVVAKLVLSDDEETRKQWNYNFELIYVIELKQNSLSTSLIVKNTGKNEFDFTSLLHSYFRVEDVNQLKIHDLNGFEFIDKVRNGVQEKEIREQVVISGETDRVYISTGNQHVLDTGCRKIKIQKNNLPDTVVWNPWVEKSKGMTDFDDEEYKSMVCIEPGYVSKRHVLKPNENFEMSQTILV